MFDRKESGVRTLSPTSHSSPQVTESKSFRTSLISMFRGGGGGAERAKADQQQMYQSLKQQQFQAHY